MARNFVQPGKQFALTAPTGGVTAGLGVVVGSIFAVALTTAAAGASFTAAVSGIWYLLKVSTEVWAEGDKIYFNKATGFCTNVAGAGLRMVGYAVVAATNPSTSGYVRLHGSVDAMEDDSRPAATSDATAGPRTYTAAEILGGTIVRDPNGASRSDVLPTAALLVAAIPGVAVGDVVDCLIVNGADAAETITIGAGTGGTFDANQTAAARIIGQNASKLVRIRFTNVTAASEAYVVYA